MTRVTSALYGFYFFEAAGALFAAVAFRHFQSHLAGKHAVFWTYAWIAQTVVFVSAAAGLAVADAGLGGTSLRTVVATIVIIASFVTSAWLFIGVHDLVTRNPLPVRRIRLIMGGIVLAVCLGASLVAWRSGPAGLFRAEPFLIVAAAVWLTGAYTIVRATGGTRGLGRWLVAAACALVGLEHVVGLAPMSVLRDSYVITASFLGTAGFLLQFVLALGLILWAADHARANSTHVSGALDTLTGLPRRGLFLKNLNDEIARARESGQHLSVFFMDLDRFKSINDSLGHDAGDAVLRAAAMRLARTMPPGALVTRLGGDEFTVLVPQLHDPDEVAELAGRVRDAIREPMKLASRKLNVGTSIGISRYPEDGGDAETLLKHADTALYVAKERGRGVFQLCTPEIKERVRTQEAVEQGLRTALADGQFVLYYQPVLAITSGRIVAMEALLRWRHPERGLLAPADFLTAADASLIIVAIGEWVLSEACG